MTICSRAKIFGSALLQPAHSVCVSSERFFSLLMFGSFFFALEHFQVGVGITWFSVLDGLRVKMFSRLIYFFQCVLFSAILAV